MNAVTQVISHVRAVIFDISGTTLDYGSRGPVVAFTELFRRNGVQVTEEEARRPMGLHKKDHIRAVLEDPDIGQRWEEANGSAPTSEDIDRLFEAFAPLQKEILLRHCDVIPGVPEVVAQLRVRGIKVANTTGFDSSMITDLVRLAQKGGYEPDIWVCPDLAGGGRPAPWMAHFAAKHLGVYPLSSFIKVGDTLADVDEAHAAGMWAVSVVRHGNEVGLSREAVENLSPEEEASLVGAARARLASRGPHYLLESTADLIPVVDEISARLARGERP